MDAINDTLPKGISPEAKIWASYIEKSIQCKEATNPNSLFITGRTVLDNEAFNKLNSNGYDVVHGLQVFYGPFSSRGEAMDFISEYPYEWPGENEWRWIHPGQPEIISSFYEPGKADLVHNASLDFQGQLIVREQQRRIAEIEDIQNRIMKKQEAAVNGDVKPTTVEMEQYIVWQRQKIKQAEAQLNGLKTHLENLLKIQDQA